MGNLKYYSFTSAWPIFRKVDGKYYWLNDEGDWKPHHNDGFFVSPRVLTSEDILRRLSQYRDGSNGARLIKRLAFYQEVLWE